MEKILPTDGICLWKWRRHCYSHCLLDDPLLLLWEPEAYRNDVQTTVSQATEVASCQPPTELQGAVAVISVPL